MQRFVSRFAAGVTMAAMFTVVTGCASSPYRLPPPVEAQQSVRSTNIVIALQQQEIFADFVKQDSSSVTNQYGLLGALVGATMDSIMNSSASRQAEAEVVPIRNALIGFDFGQEFEKALQNELVPVSWLRTRRLSQEHAIDKTRLKEMGQRYQESAILMLQTSYFLSPGMKELNIVCTATMYANDEAVAAAARKAHPDHDPPVLYRNRLTFKQALSGHHATSEAAAQAWSADHGAAIRAAMNDGISEVARMLGRDLNVFQTATNAAEAEKAAKREKEESVVFYENGPRKIMRLASGELETISK